MNQVLLVDGKRVEKPVLFALAALNERLQRYSQLDREGLAVIFAVTELRKYLLGRHCTLVTDDSAIRYIFHPDKGIPTLASHRLQHWASIWAAFDYDIMHKKAEYLVAADHLSRYPVNDVVDNVNFEDEIVFPKFLTVDSVAHYTCNDPFLSKVAELTYLGWPAHCRDSTLKPFFELRNALSLERKCLMLGNRVVIPSALQANVHVMHEHGHPGIVRMKLLARRRFGGRLLIRT